MTHTYNISGMTCGNCVAKVKSELLKLGDITGAEVQLIAPQATITMQKHIPVETLQQAVGQAGHYLIIETGPSPQHAETLTGSGSWLTTYKPLLLIAAYLIGITFIIEKMNGGFMMERWMSNFMAGFFLVFSFFKLLDLRGFADSFSMYDILAKRWRGWGYLYVLAEMGLGIAYLLHVSPLATNALAFVLMGIGLIGVVQSLRSGRTIRCACLGAVFNLPMSTVTIIENVLMMAMSGFMALQML